ncbi:prefoldin subunit 6 [Ischnura elegans]|uniref:prefoldin subunit 6 n=1 Tax=Ischnura elegans TaxID=197161 RepID=UPI001ED8815F|nr:prefoldin subunit 6 [Ischnura elegans]
MAEEVQRKMQLELDKFKQLQKDYQRAVSIRQQLDGQLSENSVVKDELDMLKPGAEVFKLIGPVLVKQSLEEAKQTVSKRMDYIKGELKRQEDLLQDLDRKQDLHRESLNKLQQQFQHMQVKAAMKA